MTIDQDNVLQTWRYFWHPVCTLAELRAAQQNAKPLRATLLGEKLIIAELAAGVIAMQDRCAHRSASLSLGCIEDQGIRCAYHGWLYDHSGRCIEIPSCPDTPIPPKAQVTAFAAKIQYDLVWVQLDSSIEMAIPSCPAWQDVSMKVVPGEPYTWPTSAGRRLENFVDLAHFPFVHDGTLGSRQHTITPIPLIDRIEGELRFGFDPPDDLELPDVALMAETRYRIFMPFAVNLEFLFSNGNRSMLWMCASPLDSGTCRSFWFTCRDHDKDGLDKPHLDFQDVVLAEDLPVIASQCPAEIPPRGFEVSVKTDKVSMTYRQWLYELLAADNAVQLKQILATTKLETAN